MSETAYEETADAPNPRPAKVDPETLALRARPARAIQFKRGVVVAIAATASVSIAATAWLALKPAALRIITEADDRGAAARPTNDALNSLPGSYGDAPKLGPALPGDLGAPILNSQRAMATETPAPEAQRTTQAADTERDRRASELKAARESGLMFQSGARPTSATEPTATTPDAAAAAVPARLAIDSERDPNAQQRKADFVGAADKGGSVNPHSLSAPASPYLLSAGSVIAASLITGLRSDLPGLVTAQVTERGRRDAPCCCPIGLTGMRSHLGLRGFLDFRRCGMRDRRNCRKGSQSRESYGAFHLLAFRAGGDRGRVGEAWVERRAQRYVCCRRRQWHRRWWCRALLWQGRLELAAPVDCIDIDAERVLAERIGRRRRFGRDGEDTRPVRYARLAAALKCGFGPFDLERFIRRAHDAGNLNRHGPLADICERICRPRVSVQKLH